MSEEIGHGPIRFPVELAAALHEIRHYAERRSGTFMDRRINRRSVRRHLVSETEAWIVIRSLGLQDFHRGPQVDHHHPEHAVWVFGPQVAGVRFYVKVSLPPADDPVGTGLIVWSFHEARFDMELPYA